MNAVKTAMDWEGIDQASRFSLNMLKKQFAASSVLMHSNYLDAAKAVWFAHQTLSNIGRGGKFSRWVESELGVSVKTAQRLCRVHEAFAELNSDTVSLFTPTAMIELSCRNLPDGVIETAIEMAGNGKVTGKIAKQAKKAKQTLEILLKDASVTETEVDDDEQIQVPGDEGTEYEDDDDSPPAKPVEAKKEPQALPTRQEVKDSQSAEIQRIQQWSEQIDTFKNKAVAIQKALERLNSEQLSMVRLMLEV